MRRHILLAAFAVLSTMISASAQNFNPTVEVTSDYSAKMLEAHKPQQKMAVPDSLLKFDLDFDYSVLSNPYKGGYDFSPYLLEMKPNPSAYTGKKLYLRAGAGYTMHPVLDFVWSPVIKNKALQMNVYASGKGYFGNYRNTVFKHVGGTLEMSPILKDDIEGRDLAFKGHNADAKAGINARYDLEKVYTIVTLGYEGIFSGSHTLDLKYNSANVGVGLYRKENGENRFSYGASLKYAFSSDAISPSKGYYGIVEDNVSKQLNSSDFSIVGYFGPHIDDNKSILVDLGLELSNYSNLFRSQSGHLYVIPKYVMNSEKMSLSLGVKLDAPLGSDFQYENFSLHQRKGQFVYPDIKFDYRLIDEHLDGYVTVTGGVNINSYSSLRKRNHFFSVLSATKVAPLLDNEIEKINVTLGFRGNIASVFKYDLSGGFLSSAGSLVDYLSVNSTVYGQNPYLSMIGQDQNKLYANFAYSLGLESFVIDGNVRLENSNLLKKGGLGFVSSPLSGDIKAQYVWRKRIYAGVHADASVARNGRLDHLEQKIDVRIPGFVNLGLDAEFIVNRKLSIWLMADNLLNQTILRTPYYAEKGVSVTGGICINL